MIGSKTFTANDGSTFGLRIVNGQNILSCTAEVAEGQGGSAHELRRFDFDELRSGQALWQVQGGKVYVVVMRVQSKSAGQPVAVDMEIPLGSGQIEQCSRTSSGLIANWQVNVF